MKGLAVERDVRDEMAIVAFDEIRFGPSRGRPINHLVSAIVVAKDVHLAVREIDLHIVVAEHIRADKTDDAIRKEMRWKHRKAHVPGCKLAKLKAVRAGGA